MIQQDYILRMIEQLGAFLRAVMRGDRSREELQGDLDEMAIECLGLPLVVLLSVPVEEAYRLIEDSERLVPEKAFMLGEICYAKANLAQEPAERGDFQEKSRYFFERAQGKIGGEMESRIALRLASGVEGGGEADQP